MITDDPYDFCSGFIVQNMVKYDSRGYSGPMGVTLQSHNTLCDCKVTQEEILFSDFVTTLNNAFKWDLVLEDIGYESGSKGLSVPTPLCQEP